MIFRSFEVRARNLDTLEDVDTGYPNPRFFFRRHACDYVLQFNSARLIQGHKSYTYYVHNRRDDK